MSAYEDGHADGYKQGLFDAKGFIPARIWVTALAAAFMAGVWVGVAYVVA